MITAAEKLISKVELSDISSIRVVLNGIIGVVNDPRSSAYDLKDAISTDPPLAARVLRRANSAFYGIARKDKAVADIQTAIVYIGFETIKELILNQSVCRLFRNNEVIFGYSRASLWEHCVATAVASRMIFRREFKQPGGQVHAAGLLHDIGIIVEDQCARDSFLKVLREFEKAPEHGLHHHEQQLLGFSHSELGEALAKRWDFPLPLRQAIGSETMPSGSLELEANLVAATVRVASWAAQRRHLGFVETPHLDENIWTDALERLHLTQRGMDLIMDEVEKELGRMRDEDWF